MAAMLPIADAFRQAERDGFIAIRRVSGSSAGAICASLVATHADFAAVRKYVAQKGPEHLSSLVPKAVRNLTSKSRNGASFGFLDLAFNPGLLKRTIVGGEPLLHSPELKAFIAGMLSAGNPRRPSLIEECAVKLTITASDVVNSVGILHERGDIVSAVEDSCSLPVLLRSFGSLAKTHYVDGGLCDNLPVDCLVGDSHSPIFAVYPEVELEKRNNSNILSYFISLLSASINHNVQRSISMVANPYRFAAKTDIGLLDFDRAVDRLGQEEWYRLTFSDAMERIVSFSKSYGFTLSRAQARVVDSADVEQFRTTLLNLTESQADCDPPLHCTKGRFVVRINHDRRMTSATTGRRIPDTITRISQMRVLTDNLRFYRTTVNVAEDSVIPTIWSAWNVTKGCEIPIVALPLSRSSLAGVAVRHCLLEFVDHKNSMSVGDVIELHSTYASRRGTDLRKLNFGQADYFGFTNSTGMKIDDVELILVYPKSLGEISLSLDTRRSKGLTCDPRALDVMSLGGVPVDISQAVVGMAVSDLDLGASVFATAIPA